MDNLVWADDNYTVYCFAWTSPLGAPKGCAQCLLLLWKLATTSVSCFDKWRTAWMEGVTNHWHRYTLGTFFPTHGGQIKIHSAFQGPCIYSDSETGIHPEYGEFDLGFPESCFCFGKYGSGWKVLKLNWSIWGFVWYLVPIIWMHGQYERGHSPTQIWYNKWALFWNGSVRLQIVENVSHPQLWSNQRM